MKTASRFLLSSLFCLTLCHLSGCGGGVSLTPAERAEVEKYVANHGTKSLIKYLDDVSASDDKERVFKYVKCFVLEKRQMLMREVEVTVLLSI